MNIVDVMMAKQLAGGSGGGGGGGSSSPYDLVIVAEAEEDLHSVPSSAYHITHGSIEACEQKIANMEPVNVFLGWYRAYDSELPNVLYPTSYPNNEFNVAYRYIDFGYSPRIMYTSNYEIDDVLWDD